MTYEKLHEQYQPLILGQVKRWSQYHEYDDIYQETSIALWLAQESHDESKSSLNTWINNRVNWHMSHYHQKHKPREYLKSSKVERVDDIEGTLKGDLKIKDTLVSDLNIETLVTDNMLIDEILNNVTDRQRKILILTAHNYTLREIAEVIGFSHETVRVEINKIRKRLRGVEYD